MKWQIQSTPGRCESLSCAHPDILPGEPVRLVLNGRQRWCWLCAWKRLQESVPRAELPQQPQPSKARIYVAQGQTVPENFDTFDRRDVGGAVRKNILTRRELEQANAHDPKLRQAGDR